MAEHWKALDFHGGGLQEANVKLARLLKRRRVAYALAALFFLGLHRDYLDDRRGAWAYRVATAAAVLCLLAGQAAAGGLLLAAMAASALYDVVRMEGRIARINKALRMQVYLAQTAGAPPGYRGRFTDPQEAPDRRPGRAPSFAEQERLLRELSRKRPDER